MRKSVQFVSVILLALVILALNTPLLAAGGVVFEDIATLPDSGIDYSRVPSASNEILQSLMDRGTITFDDSFNAPVKSRGAPGVALFDHDDDGDLDIYVTNGPGVDNSLFSSQLQETGALTFVDVGAASGAGAQDQDSTGTCFGDIDNDGDHDLYVLGNDEPNRLFENQGDGTFVDITAASGTGGGSLTSASCAFGDIDSDSLLDVVVANTYDNWDSPVGIAFAPFAFNEHNQLFRNTGSNVFTDVSESSGIRQLAGITPGFDDPAGLTWSLAFVDFDLDGDVDLVTADDQGAIPEAIEGGLDRGVLHLFENDGTGQFTDVNVERGIADPGGWMGLAFGDLNCDRNMDFFATNFGSYGGWLRAGGVGPVLPDQLSRWYLGAEDGTFSAPDAGAFGPGPFGWGASMLDYDNDADLDVIFHGGMELTIIVDASNGGVLMQNQDCSATFVRDVAALAGSTDHLRRNIHGVAVGDLDRDGFEDIVSVSNLDFPEPTLVVPIAAIGDPGPTFFDASSCRCLTSRRQVTSSTTASSFLTALCRWRSTAVAMATSGCR